MAEKKEQSFVTKRGEGLHSKNLIKHTVLQVETPRPSSVDTSAGTIPASTTASGAMTKAGGPVKTSYISPMARARLLAKQRRETAMSDSTGASKDWDESQPSSSSPSNSESAASTPAKPQQRLIPYSGGLIPSSANLIPGSSFIPKSGYIPKSGFVEEEASGSGRLPKFGVWDNNNNNDDNGPCYTLLFENVAQEKRIGGPIRIHAPRSCSPARNEDLYNYNPASIKAARKTRQYPSLLCCFVGS